MMYEAQYNSPLAMELATVTKLVRNLCMIAVIPLVGILYGAERSTSDAGKINYLSMIPWFIVGFAAMSAIRTIGDQGELAFGLLEPAQWQHVVMVLRDTVGSKACSFSPANWGATILRSLRCSSPSYSISVGPNTWPIWSPLGEAEKLSLSRKQATTSS